jgi:hypothetical protein
MGSEVFYARNNQIEKQKESLALIRPVRFFRHRVRVSRGHLRRIGRMTTTSDRAINEEQKTSCEACEACEESNEKKLVDLARCSVVLELYRSINQDRRHGRATKRGCAKIVVCPMPEPAGCLVIARHSSLGPLVFIATLCIR